MAASATGPHASRSVSVLRTSGAATGATAGCPGLAVGTVVVPVTTAPAAVRTRSRYRRPGRTGSADCGTT